MNAMAVESPAAKARDQAGVDIQNAVFEIAGNQDVREEPAHHDPLRAGGATGAENGVAVRLGRRKRLVADHYCGNAGRLGDREAPGFRGAGNDQQNLGVELTAGNVIQQIPERGAAAGNEHHQAQVRAFGLAHAGTAWM